MHKRRALALSAVSLVCVCANVAPALGEPTANVQLRFNPDRVGVPTNLTATATLGALEGGPPGPITGLAVYLPAGLRLDVKGAASCSPERLEADGVQACPPNSRIGFGGGVGVIDLAEEITREPFTLDLFLGPRQRGLTLLLGYFSAVSPVPIELLVRAQEIHAPSPYGVGFDFQIPSIGTLPGVSDASIESLFVTVGAPDIAVYGQVHKKRILRHLQGIVTPKRCPVNGFPYEALVSFQDNTNLTTQGAIPCPR